MKKIALLFALLLLLTSCAAEPARYAQETLPRPSSIKATGGSNTTTYRAGDENYEKIFEVIARNWWKTAKDTPGSVGESALEDVDSVKRLRTSSDYTYVRMEDSLVRFLYEDEPMGWTVPNGEMVEVRELMFVLPEKTETEENVRGFFVVWRTDPGAVTEGIYTYYYAPELTNDFWRFLAH